MQFDMKPTFTSHRKADLNHHGIQIDRSSTRLAKPHIPYQQNEIFESQNFYVEGIIKKIICKNIQEIMSK